MWTSQKLAKKSRKRGEFGILEIWIVGPKIAENIAQIADKKMKFERSRTKYNPTGRQQAASLAHPPRAPRQVEGVLLVDALL